MHRVDNHAGLPGHIAGEVGIDHILAAHCFLQSRCVENVTLDDGYPLWIGVGEAAGASEVEG
jgi:hypothetical protein